MKKNCLWLMLFISHVSYATGPNVIKSTAFDSGEQDRKILDEAKALFEKNKRDFSNYVVKLLKDKDSREMGVACMSYITSFYHSESLMIILNAIAKFGTMSDQKEGLNTCDRDAQFFNELLAKHIKQFTQFYSDIQHSQIAQAQKHALIKKNNGRFLAVLKSCIGNRVYPKVNVIKENMGSQALSREALEKIFGYCWAINTNKSKVFSIPEEYISTLNHTSLLDLYASFNTIGNINLLEKHIKIRMENLQDQELLDFVVLCARSEKAQQIIEKKILNPVFNRPDLFLNAEWKKDYFPILALCVVYAPNPEVIHKVIKKTLVHLEGGPLFYALWWCACFNQKKPLNMGVARKLMSELELIAHYIHESQYDQVVPKFYAMKKMLAHPDFSIHWNNLFDEIKKSSETYFTHRQAMKSNAEESRSRSVYDLSKQWYLDYWVLDAAMRYNSDEIREKIIQYTKIFKDNQDSFFEKSDSKAKHDFLSGIELTLSNPKGSLLTMVDLYHVALLDACAEKSKRLYVATELKKILEAGKTYKPFIENNQDAPEPLSFFSGSFKGLACVKGILSTLDLKPEEVSEESFHTCVEGILNQTLASKNCEKLGSALLGKLYKSLQTDHHWFTDEALASKTDLSPMRLLQLFYIDSVNAAAQKFKEYTTARCPSGIALDAKRVISSLYRFQNTDYTKDLKCNPII